MRYLDRAAVMSGVALAETGGRLRADHLLRADLTPVASPALFPPDRTHLPAALRDCTLLHVLAAADDWRLWLAAAGLRGIDAARGPKFDSYALTSEAAAQGLGVALGRVGLIEGEIASGRLVAPFSVRRQGPRAWFLLTPRGQAKPRVAAFRAWMLHEAGGVPADHSTNS